MSAAVVSNNAELTIAREPGMFARLKRGLAVSGWLGMLLGGALGYIATRPHIYFPLHAEARVLYLFQLTGMLMIGLVLALIIRVAMRGAFTVSKLSAALLGIALSIVTYEVVDNRLYEVFYELSEPDNSLRLAMMFMGTLGALFGLNLGRSTRSTTRSTLAQQVIEVEPLAERGAGQRAGRPRRQRQRRQQPAATSQARELEPVRRAVRRARRARATDPAPPSEVRRIEVQPRAEPQIAIKPTRAKKKRGIKVKMGRAVTSVCPYCLEEVAPNDPRGRVVCRICGTPHHGDCWAITGKCEVPHLQT